jgi:hypothetical protein
MLKAKTKIYTEAKMYCLKIICQHGLISCLQQFNYIWHDQSLTRLKIWWCFGLTSDASNHLLPVTPSSSNMSWKWHVSSRPSNLLTKAQIHSVLFNHFSINVTMFPLQESSLCNTMNNYKSMILVPYQIYFTEKSCSYLSLLIKLSVDYVYSPIHQL